MEASNDIALEARNISKSFGGIHALVDVSLELHAGEVHALMGENGAGKSTLMKILAGLYHKDTGEILMDERPVSIRSPHEAMQHGIAMIHQELMPVPDMTVAENLMLGREPRGRIPGTIDHKAMRRESQRLLAMLDVEMAVNQPMRSLTVAEMQTVEIARALGGNASIVIMDEPTAAISDREVDALFEAIRTLKKRGVAIVYITHRMDEVFRIADRITVLRDGHHIATEPASELDETKLISLMVGRELSDYLPRSHVADDEVVMRVDRLGRGDAFRDVTFELHHGEILGFAGLMGAGRTELVRAIFGFDLADVGNVTVHGRHVRFRHPREAMRAGLGMVTEDRQGHGIVPSMSVRQNITLAALGKCCVGPMIRHFTEGRVAGESIEAHGIRSDGDSQPISELSGGNQQKVVIARTLLAEPDIVILDEPTRGIDVGAKREVYEIITQLASKGKAVLLVSSELPELLSLCDRILVMRQGEVTAELKPAETTQEEILGHAIPV